MRRWPGTRNVHCVIDHLQHPFFASSSHLKAPRTPTLRQLSYTSQYYCNAASILTPIFQSRSLYNPASKTPTTHIHPPTSTTISSRAMSSDDAYMSFLDKANADLDSGRSQATTQQSSSSAARTETVDINVKVPTPLTSVDAFYISETDEPFEPVALRWEGAGKGLWPDSSHFSRLISPDTDLSSSIESLSPSAFDPKNQYSSALRAVRAAAVQGGGDESAVEVKVYCVEVGTSRVEYYAVALDVEGGLIVGLRAKAIES
ncbi:hypothetical protein BDW62DRAFT_181992 [Aspergillus aurantiobrunneus]